MNKYEITERIENFAPVETAEAWDCVGYMVDTGKTDVSKIMLCLTVTEDVIKQAKEQDCDMIIAHHPLFEIKCFSGFRIKSGMTDQCYCHSELVSESYRPLIDIYSAHTNLDKANGGTTDTLIKALYCHSEHSSLRSFANAQDDLCEESHKNEKVTISSRQGRGYTSEFLRFVDFENGIEVLDLARKLKKISPNLRYVNNCGQKVLKRVAFCAGSGSEFIKEAREFGADCLVTGDLKFHTALDSEIVLFDIGHFESEILVLPVLKDIIGNGVEVVFANEASPFNVLI